MPLLTRREKEAVHFVADGLKNREIAERVKVKEHSIRNYLYRIFEELSVSTWVELILYACLQPSEWQLLDSGKAIERTRASLFTQKNLEK